MRTVKREIGGQVDHMGEIATLQMLEINRVLTLYERFATVGRYICAGQRTRGLRVYSPTDPKEQLKMSWWGEMQEQIDYYFVYGESMDDVIKGYRTLTGKAPIMPKWAISYICFQKSLRASGS